MATRSKPCELSRLGARDHDDILHVLAQLLPEDLRESRRLRGFTAQRLDTFATPLQAFFDAWLGLLGRCLPAVANGRAALRAGAFLRGG